jgi:hypothetical protein
MLESIFSLERRMIFLLTRLILAVSVLALLMSMSKLSSLAFCVRAVSPKRKINKAVIKNFMAK